MKITRIELRECVELPDANWTHANPVTHVQPVDETDDRDLVGRKTFWTAYWPNKDAPQFPMAQNECDELPGLCAYLMKHFGTYGTAMKDRKENDK